MNPKTRNILIVIAMLVVSFGIGAAWQYAQADHARRELATTTTELETVRHDLALERLESTLALATVAAQLGNFERARQLASDFFTGLQDNGAASSDAERAAFSEMLRTRDEIITSLSRSQPEAGLNLARMLGTYRDALGQTTEGLDAPGTMPAAASPATRDTMD